MAELPPIGPLLAVALFCSAAILSLAAGVRVWRRNRTVSPETVMAGLGYDAMPQPRELDMARPWRERVLRPLLRRLYGLGRRLTPGRNIDMLQRQLIMAGQPGGLTVADFMGLRFLVSAASGVVVFMAMAARLPLLSSMMLALIGFLVGLYLPNLWLRHRVSSRQWDIARQLPDALDMMSICVDAGLGFEAAVQKVAYHWHNDLALELRRVINEIRLGVRRVDALHHLVDRTGVEEIGAFVAVLVQADRLGISIRDVLHTQAVQMRIHRRLRAEEEARKLPLKMLFPLVFFIFPAIFVVVLGPAVPRIVETFGSLQR